MGTLGQALSLWGISLSIMGAAWAGALADVVPTPEKPPLPPCQCAMKISSQFKSGNSVRGLVDHGRSHPYHFDQNGVCHQLVCRDGEAWRALAYHVRMGNSVAAKAFLLVKDPDAKAWFESVTSSKFMIQVAGTACRPWISDDEDFVYTSLLTRNDNFPGACGQ